MPNTGNTQQIINYGATANDGTGDPLRTAFIKTDENFDNVWLAGPVGSNITISNNTIQTNNTNGNIIIKPNGTGIIQANASILPNSTGTRDLGSSALSWRRAYIDELLPDSLTVSGDATIGGNLTVEGDTIQIGNITTDTLTIQLANTAGNKAAANGAGITVGANDAIATFLFNSTSNTWVTNIGANIGGNITASYFVGNGSQLTGLPASYGNANVAAYLPTYTGNISAGNISVSNVVNIINNLNVKTGTFTGDARGENSIYAGVPLFTVLGSDVVAQFSGNVNAYTQFNFQNGNSGSLASGDYVITADNGDDETFFFNMGLGSSNHDDPDFFGDTSTPNDAYLYVVGTDATGPGDTGPGNLIIGSTNGVIKFFVGNTAQANVIQTLTTSGVVVKGNVIPAANAVYSLGNATNYWANLWVANNTIYIGGVPLGMTSGNVLTVNGNAVLSNNSSTAISTTGNITANYFSGNGSLLTGISVSTGNFTFSNNQISVSNEPMEISALGAGSDVDIEAADAVFIEALVGEVDIRSADETFIATDSGGNIWTFGIDGTLTAPGNITASGLLTDTVTGITANAGNVNINQITGLGGWLNAVGANLSGNVNADSLNIVDINVTGNITSNLYADGEVEILGNVNIENQLTVDGLLVDTVSGITANAGNIDINQITGLGGYLNATGAVLSGNISAQNFVGSGSNVELVAGAYTTTFDNTGNVTMPSGTLAVTNLTASGITVLGNTSTVTTSNYAIGYRDIPQVTFSANANAAVADAGKHYYSTTAGNLALTILNDSSVLFPTGATLTVVVNAAGNVLVNQGTGVTLYQAGSATTGNRVVGAYGLATVMKVAANTWVVSGTGVY